MSTCHCLWFIVYANDWVLMDCGSESEHMTMKGFFHFMAVSIWTKTKSSLRESKTCTEWSRWKIVCFSFVINAHFCRNEKTFVPSYLIYYLNHIHHSSSKNVRHLSSHLRRWTYRLFRTLLGSHIFGLLWTSNVAMFCHAMISYN